MEFTPESTMTAVVLFQDKEREARVTVRFPLSLGMATIIAAALELRSRMLALSDAVSPEVKFFHRQQVSGDTFGGFDVPIASALGLFYRNDGEFDALYIPAPLPTLFETTGPYAGIRLDTADATVAAMVEELNLALAATGALIAFPVGPGFLGGGRVL